MAESGHALHPAICRSDTPELRVVVVACVGHGEAFCENERSCRNATTQDIKVKFVSLTVSSTNTDSKSAI